MNNNDKTISFNRGVPAVQSLPLDKVAEIGEEVIDEHGDTILQYGSSRGFLPLRTKLANWYEGATPDQILLGNGSLQILDMIAKLYVNSDDSVLVEWPSYDRAITIFERAGAEVHGVKLEKDGPNLNQLEDLLKTQNPCLFYTIPDFQNPTGICASRAKRKAVAELGEKYGTIIVEDAPYRRLRYRGDEKPTIRSFNPEKVIQMSSLSKLIGPGIRVGWLVAGVEIVEELARYAEDTYITPSLLSQGFANGLFKDDWFEENVQNLISLYEPRLDSTLSSLDRYFPEADWVRAEGGFFVGLWLPDSSEVDKFYRRAKEGGLELSSPEGFFSGYEGEGFVRLPFPALSPSRIEEGVKRLSRIWKDL